MDKKMQVIGLSGLIRSLVNSHLKRQGYRVGLMLHNVLRASRHFGKKYDIVKGDVSNPGLQYFNKDSLQHEFESSGFEVKAFYSDVAGTVFSPKSPDMAIVAAKAT